MRVEGKEAAVYSAVRMDSMAPVEGKGTLLLADDMTGEVRWREGIDKERAETLGARAIRIVRRPTLSSGR